MNRMTAVGLCTCVVLAGCALEDEPAARVGAAPERAAQQVETGERTVHGAVRGTYDGAPFTAVVTITEFVAREGAVRAVGTLGEVAGALTPEQTRALTRETFDFSVSVGPTVRPQVVVMGDAGADAGIGTICDVLYVRLLPQTRELEGRSLALEEIMLDVEAAPSVDSAIGRALCEVSALLDPAGSAGGPTPANVARAVELLNTVVRVKRDAVPDGGTLDVPAVDAGAMPPAPSYDASVPIKF